MGRLLVIAGTSGPFADFGPYAPALNDGGMVAFHATRRTGPSGAFCGDGGPISYLNLRARYRSHPDINEAGQLCAYADLEDGREAVVTGEAGKAPDVVASATHPAIGPLGPTMNRSGAIAFRASTAAGPGVFVLEGDRILAVAESAGGRFSGFEGLPVILDDGRVVFRADRGPRRQSIHAWSPTGQLATLAETGERFAALGRFPHANARGTVVFTAVLPDGRSGLFRSVGGNIEPLLDSKAGYEEFRGALIDDSGRVVFYATPTGGTLTIYTWAAGTVSRVIGLGDDLAGCPITDFALNPVSINNRGQIALRLKLADGRQFIARLDVFG